MWMRSWTRERLRATSRLPQAAPGLLRQPPPWQLLLPAAAPLRRLQGALALQLAAPGAAGSLLLLPTWHTVARPSPVGTAQCGRSHLVGARHGLSRVPSRPVHLYRAPPPVPLVRVLLLAAWGWHPWWYPPAALVAPRHPLPLPRVTLRSFTRGRRPLARLAAASLKPPLQVPTARCPGALQALGRA